MSFHTCRQIEAHVPPTMAVVFLADLTVVSVVGFWLQERVGWETLGPNSRKKNYHHWPVVVVHSPAESC